MAWRAAKGVKQAAVVLYCVYLLMRTSRCHLHVAVPRKVQYLLVLIRRSR